MPLTYDPSAIRYASTQEAYGCTWTLNKIEDDGAQVWKNSQGQEAIVLKICAKASCAPDKDFSVHGSIIGFFPMNDEFRKQRVEGTWENLEPNDYACPPPVSGDQPAPAASKYPPIERELGTSYDLKTIAKRYDLKAPPSLGTFQADPPYLREYCEADCEITQELFERGFFVNWNKVDEIQVAGDSIGTRVEAGAHDSRIKAAIKAKAGQNELGAITMSDSEIFNLLKKVCK